MKKSAFLLAVVFIVSLPLLSFAWGKKGHTIVAEIACSLLNDKTREAVQNCLGATTIEEAATWMDAVRGHHEFDYMKPWHYVNVEKGGQYVPNHEDNIINALNNAISNLEHKDRLSPQEIKTNLMIVFHLAGDLHMPLHVGYGEDKGGNSIDVSYLGKPSNLHTVWDSRIITTEHICTDDCLALMKNKSKDEIAKLKVINVVQWMQQPRSLLGEVYNFQNNTIDLAYADKNKKIIEQQLLIAGIRLSAILQHVFKS